MESTNNNVSPLAKVNWHTRKAALCSLISLVLLGSCSVDNAYDMSKDIDLTMALGSNGLALKLGNTEKMYLKDIIKIDASNLVDTITSGSNRGLYYLVKSGSSKFNVNVKSIAPFDVSPIHIETNNLFIAQTNIPGFNSQADTMISVSSDVSVKMPNIPVEVKEIHTISLNNVSATIKLSTDNSKFKIGSYTNLKIKFPNFVKSSSLNSANEYFITGSSQTITIPIQSLEFPVNGSFGQKVDNGEIRQSGTIFINGDIAFSTNGTVNIVQGETAKAVFNISFSQISSQQITGLVNPTINFNAAPLQIKSGLPDFLQDDEIHFSATNPTLKLSFNTQNLPVPIIFQGVVESKKSGQTLASVSIPESGHVNIAKNSTTVSYFSQTGTPFDPFGTNLPIHNETVSSLNKLVTKLPDEIGVNFNDGKVTADQSVEHTIRLGQSYGVGVDYQILIPFQFDKDLKILYNDSIVDMNKDLKDYQAEGLTITATAVNTIPLNLVTEIVPYDIHGKIIKEIAVESATIALGTLDAPKETEVSVKFTPTSPADVSKIEKLKFRFTASASDLTSDKTLLSAQYVQLNNLRIKLNGKVITNFN
ncbi:MAG: hypothetical protein BGN96_12740 [Bacteroidales bacterium 45-6]|nr:MAG: hypothetical protein BGN96_12740 [Bacteroidales bacterium 45-6]